MFLEIICAVYKDNSQALTQKLSTKRAWFVIC